MIVKLAAADGLGAGGPEGGGPVALARASWLVELSDY